MIELQPVSETAYPLPPLRLTGNSVDLLIDLSILNDIERYAKSYEEECFKRVIGELGPGEVAYGAHILNRAFNHSLSARHISIPDGLVGQLDGGNPEEGSIVRITRITEARTGRINGNYKLRGFKNLTAGVRENPEFFTSAIRAVLRGRGGLLNPLILLAPDDGEIEVDFYCPRVQLETDEDVRQMRLEGHPFKRVNYKTVLLPPFSPAI